MSLHDGDFGNARGRREAFENRDAIERRARIEAASASAVRDRLEKGSPSWARRNFAGMLNELVRDAAGRELPGLAALAEIRKGQKSGAVRLPDIEPGPIQCPHCGHTFKGTDAV